MVIQYTFICNRVIVEGYTFENQIALPIPLGEPDYFICICLILKNCLTYLIRYSFNVHSNKIMLRLC